MFGKLLSVLSILALGVVAQNPCDDAYGAHCPEKSGWSVGECLKKVEDGNAISEKCAEFINMHDKCKNEIDMHCKGNEYTGDTLPCLTEWTNVDLISVDCAASFPKKAEVEKKMSKKAKKNADKRRK
jgi:hypothetical protein